MLFYAYAFKICKTRGIISAKYGEGQTTHDRKKPLLRFSDLSKFRGEIMGIGAIEVILLHFFMYYKKGWKGLLLPIIIFLPFFLDAQFGSFFAERLGEDGAKAFSGSILSFVPALLAVSAILISKKGTGITPKFLIEDTGKSLIKVVPTGILVLFAYFISNLFDDIGAGESIGQYVSSLNVNPILLAFVIPLFCAILGMLIPGSSQVKIFGASIITIVAAAGGDPIIAAAMLPCICGAMHGVTPPYAVVTYTAMGIAEAPLKATLLNSIPWLLLHYLLSVAALLVGYVIII